MNWTEITNHAQLDILKLESSSQPVLIFKHSTRCSISRTVLDRLERNWNVKEVNHVKPYFLDLITYRNISNQIEERFDVEHESPQVIVLQDGKAVFNTSHFGIDYKTLKQAIDNLSISKN